MERTRLKQISDTYNFSKKPFWEELLSIGVTKEELEEWAENAFDEIYHFVESTVMLVLEDRAGKGKYKAMLEPFSTLPSFLHKPPMEDQVMEKLCAELQGESLVTIWDRRDDRVVLEVKWNIDG